MRLTDIRPTEDVAMFEKIIQYDVKTGWPHRATVRHKKKNGEIIDVQVEGNAVDYEGKKTRVVTVIDLTIELKWKREVDKNIARFNIVSKATSDVIWDWDLTTGQITWNHGIKGIFGYKRNSFSHTWRKSKIHPDDHQRVSDCVDQAVHKCRKKLKIEYRFLCADGNYCTVLDRAFILYNDRGQAVRMIGSMQDISERINSLRKIESQNARLREISWIQAHKVRAPLSSILGLVQLITDGSSTTEETGEITKLIAVAATQLDQALRETIS